MATKTEPDSTPPAAKPAPTYVAGPPPDEAFKITRPRTVDEGLKTALQSIVIDGGGTITDSTTYGTEADARKAGRAARYALNTMIDATTHRAVLVVHGEEGAFTWVVGRKTRPAPTVAAPETEPPSES